MAFTFLQNITLANYAVSLLRIKTELKNAGWTVQDSGDGQNFPNPQIYGNGTDVITVANTGGTYVAGNIANIKSWFRLRSPAGLGGCEIICQHSGFNPGSDSFGFLFIPESKTNSLWAGAAADNYGTLPANTVGIRAMNGGSSGVPTSGNGFNGYGTTSQNLDMAIGGAAEGYAFYAFTRTAASRIWRGIWLDYLGATLTPSDVHPYVFGWFNDSKSSFWATAGRPFDTLNTSWYCEATPETPNTSFEGAYQDSGDPTTGATHRKGGHNACLLRPIIVSSFFNEIAGNGANPYTGNLMAHKGAWWYRSGKEENFTSRGCSEWPGLKGKSILFHLGGGGATDFARATGQNLVAQSSGAMWVICDSTVDFTDPGGASITAAVTVDVDTTYDISTYNGMSCLPEDDLPTTQLAIEMAPTAVDITGYYEVFVNRVWDTAKPGHVSWRTTFVDSTGTKYPGPGVFGVNTSDFCFERYSIVR